MKEQHEFINAGKSRVCDHDHLEGQLFIRRTVSGIAERQYGYVVHPATWESRGRGKPRKKLSKRVRCYAGRLSYYFTGRRCHGCLLPVSKRPIVDPDGNLWHKACKEGAA
ncbi:MAG: hypothetical protein QXJ74_05270 [Nitrososphaera sp.]